MNLLYLVEDNWQNARGLSCGKDYNSSGVLRQLSQKQMPYEGVHIWQPS